MHYKSKSDYDSGLAVAEMFGAGYAFRQKNSYAGQPREERLRYGHRLAAPKPKPAPIDPDTLTVKLEIIRQTSSPFVLASITREFWSRPYFGAVPYLAAMASMDSFTDDYGQDSGKSIGLYFLANATTWRGPIAKAIKARIKELTR